MTRLFLSTLLALVTLAACSQISAPNRPPTVALGTSATSGKAPLTVTFEASAGDPDGDALTYTWDFGDGETVENGLANQVHEYENPGSFTASVTVSDGQTSDTATVTVEAIDQLFAEGSYEGSMTGTGAQGQEVDFALSVEIYSRGDDAFAGTFVVEGATLAATCGELLENNVLNCAYYDIGTSTAFNFSGTVSQSSYSGTWEVLGDAGTARGEFETTRVSEGQ